MPIVPIRRDAPASIARPDIAPPPRIRLPIAPANNSAGEPQPDNNADYDVGYGKPPRHSRFKPGQSGNPQRRRQAALPAAPGLRRGRLYSPDLNPIEQVFAKLKHLLRKAAERSATATWQRVGSLLDNFTPSECANYFVNSGYARA